jgi:hypothetical protein
VGGSFLALYFVLNKKKTDFSGESRSMQSCERRAQWVSEVKTSLGFGVRLGLALWEKHMSRRSGSGF